MVERCVYLVADPVSVEVIDFTDPIDNSIDPLIGRSYTTTKIVNRRDLEDQLLSSRLKSVRDLAKAGIVMIYNTSGHSMKASWCAGNAWICRGNILFARASINGPSSYRGIDQADIAALLGFVRSRVVY